MFSHSQQSRAIPHASPALLSFMKLIFRTGNVNYSQYTVRFMIFLILKIVLSFQILDRSGINRAAVERPNCPTADNAEFGKQRYDAHIPQSARN